MVAQQAEMEDIISSIRSTVAEEKAKVGSGSADLIDAAAAEDEVLELTADEMVEAPSAASAAPAQVAAEAEELFDISAFAASGETRAAVADAPSATAGAVADLLGEDAAAAPEAKIEAAAPAEQPQAAATGESADEFDQLLAQISENQQKQMVSAEAHKQALMAEEEPLGAAMPMEEKPVAAPAAPAGLEPPVTVNGNGHRVQLSAMGDVNGMQVALPAEVLALALRPMVQEWLQENLAGVVEKLVKDEISKLTQG